MCIHIYTCIMFFCRSHFGFSSRAPPLSLAKLGLGAALAKFALPESAADRGGRRRGLRLRGRCGRPAALLREVEPRRRAGSLSLRGSMASRTGREALPTVTQQSEGEQGAGSASAGGGALGSPWRPRGVSSPCALTLGPSSDFMAASPAALEMSNFFGAIAVRSAAPGFARV